MPVLTLKFEADGLDPWSIGEVLAVMLYPHDETSRQKWRDMMWAEWHAELVLDGTKPWQSAEWETILLEGNVEPFIKN